MEKIAFIGTGSMGRPMIDKLLQSGYGVQVYDHDPDATQPVVEWGAIRFDTPSEAAQNCTTVVTCLPLPHHVLENMLGPDGALSGMAPQTTWIDTSTTDYHNTLRIAAAAAKKGVYSLEAPVSNLSHMGVDFANTSFFIGGDKAGYDLSRGVVECMAEKAFYVGKIGQAQSVKLLTNLLFYTASMTMGEVLCLATEAGIPMHVTWEHMVRSNANSVAFEQFAPFLFDGSYDRSCTLEIAVKDMSLTVAMADEFGVALPVGRAVERRFWAAGQRFDGQDFHIKVIRLSEDANDIKLRLLDYAAPSKYGSRPDTPPPQDFITDEIGRVKPKLRHEFKRAGQERPTPAQKGLLKLLQDFVAEVNSAILAEAQALGRATGLEPKLVSAVIQWSVGASVVSDFPQRYRYDPTTIERMSNLHSGLKLPALSNLLSALTTEKVHAYN